MPKKFSRLNMSKRGKTISVAINGFGRIGRAAFRIAQEKRNLEIVAVNDITDAKTLAHLLQYDSVFGRYPHDVKVRANALIVDGKIIPVLSQKDPAKLPWKRLKVDVVLECTGRFTKSEEAAAHLKAGARKVIIAAPVKGGGAPMIILGVNHDTYDAKMNMISNASCTTNCIVPIAQVMQKKFGIKKAMMTTIHSYTADQRLHDAPHEDLRRARAAAHNIVPTTTGAASSTGEAIKELKGLFDGIAIRVPTIDVSLSDFTFLLKRKTTKEEINRTLVAATKSPRYAGVLAVTDKPLVSSDFIGDPHSCTVDLSLTQVVDGDLVKVIAWYDNEWGYSNRLVEMVSLVAR